jgi:hypothetical protein
MPYQPEDNESRAELAREMVGALLEGQFRPPIKRECEREPE